MPQLAARLVLHPRRRLPLRNVRPTRGAHVEARLHIPVEPPLTTPAPRRRPRRRLIPDQPLQHQPPRQSEIHQAHQVLPDQDTLQPTRLRQPAHRPRPSNRRPDPAQPRTRPQPHPRPPLEVEQPARQLLQQLPHRRHGRLRPRSRHPRPLRRRPEPIRLPSKLRSEPIHLQQRSPHRRRTPTAHQRLPRPPTQLRNLRLHRRLPLLAVPHPLIHQVRMLITRPLESSPRPTLTPITRAHTRAPNHRHPRSKTRHGTPDPEKKRPQGYKIKFFSQVPSRMQPWPAPKSDPGGMRERRTGRPVRRWSARSRYALTCSRSLRARSPHRSTSPHASRCTLARMVCKSSRAAPMYCPASVLLC